MTAKSGGETLKQITKIDVTELASNKKLRVAAYCRVSTDQAEQLTSLEAQKTHYENHIRSNPDWEFAGLYYDEGISGTKMDRRDGLNRMIDDCLQGKIDFIIIKSLSRFARNTVDCLQIVRRLCEAGIYIFFEKENINTQKMKSELLLSILSSLAQSESESISSNEKWSIQKRYKDGTFVGTAPLGYRNVDGQMEIVPEEAEAVRFIFNEYLSGNGSTVIARKLKEMGVVSHLGAPFSASGVIGILKNEKYKGDVLFQKTYTDSEFNRHKNKGDCTQYYVENHHEGIVSAEDFDRVQELLEWNRQGRGNKEGNTKGLNRYPFSGKLICGECGNGFKRRTHRALGGNYGAYSCNSHINDKESCKMLFICEDSLEAAFTTMMNKLIAGRNQVLKPLQDAFKNVDNSANEAAIQKIDKLIEESTEQRLKIKNLFAKSYLEPAIYWKEDNDLQAKITELSEERALLSQINDGTGKKMKSLKELLHFTDGHEPITEFDGELVERFMESAKITSRSSVTFILRCGLELKERL